MVLDHLIKFRQRIHQDLAWWMLLLTLAATYYSPDGKSASNVYIILVLVPVILSISPLVLKAIFAYPATKIFIFLSIYFSIMSFVGPETEKIDNNLMKIVSVWGFFILIFYIKRYRPELFIHIDKAMVGLGLLWLFILVLNWDSFWKRDLTTDISSISYGVFSHHLKVGWMLAVMSLLSLQRCMESNFRSKFWIFSSVIFIVFLTLCQARGGYVVFLAGFLVMLALKKKNFNVFHFATTFILFSFLILIHFFLPDFYSSIMERGASLRIDIWKNWFHAWTSNVWGMLFGYGLGSSSANMVENYRAAHYHNLYMSTLFYGGVTGLSLFFSWILVLARYVIQNDLFKNRWIPVLVGMLFGFVTDGDKIFTYPGEFMFCFTLPAFCLSLSGFTRVNEVSRDYLGTPTASSAING